MQPQNSVVETYIHQPSSLPQGMICMTLSFVRAVLISYFCLLVGELQENWTTHAVAPEFCLAKVFPFET